MRILELLKLKKYINKYLRHKFWVAYYGFFLNVPIMQLILHDWDKLIPHMFSAYMNYWFGEHTPDVIEKYNLAILKHIHRSKHHYEYYICDDWQYGIMLYNIPDRDLAEMIADWLAVAKVKNVSCDKWWNENKGKIRMNDEMKQRVEWLLFVSKQFFEL